MYNVTTLLVPSAVPEEPTTVNANSPNSTSIIVTWTPSTVTNGILLRYEVQYKLAAGDCSSEDRSSATSVSDVALTRSILIYSLKKYHRYCVFVRAYTSVGPGEYNYTSVRTNPDSE